MKIRNIRRNGRLDKKAKQLMGKRGRKAIRPDCPRCSSARPCDGCSLMGRLGR